MPAVLSGTIVVEKDYPDEMTLMEALEAFGDEFDTDPETINGKVFVGICDGCQKIILEGETYSESEDEEDIHCSVCIDKHQKELAQNAAETAEETPQDPADDCSMPIDQQIEQMRDEGVPEEVIAEELGQPELFPDMFAEEHVAVADAEDPEDQ